MTGYIKITATTRDGREGLEVRTDVRDVSTMDRMQVLDALCRGLKIGPSELKLFVSLKGLGILDEAIAVEPTRDECVKGPDVDWPDQLLSTLLGGADK